jgi:hypothetical protein
MKRYHLLTLGTLALFLSSCLTTKMDKWVDKKYAGTLNAPTKKAPDYLTVTSGLVTSDSKLSTTKMQVKNMLPLLFYWQMDYRYTCTLNPKIPVNTFQATMQTYANSKGLKQKLNGQKLELSVDKIPNVFALNDRSHMVWVIYAFGWDKVTFRPDNQELMVSYKITKDGVETGKGVVSVPNNDKLIGLRFLQSVKKATNQYLDQYNENIKVMSKVAVDKIVTEVTAQNTALVQ